ncbi:MULTISPECIES: ATP-binding protein [Glaesserella]|uniref:Selenocysteine synthase n=1 Tax=Glaesserella australis TaxID=2094024 RepID=A0A328BZA4_9PAST|nr:MULTISPECIES: helix-turn-helix domain-containing protein [Glaesserella]AUI65481.1 selenocysteine synthase [Glaesserella sp. 15-184]RAL19678.1 selenocysteine synthase [Glaesserella australis]
MKTVDALYFPRTELATRLLSSLDIGITHAFTLFAPRRMGKTQFLLNDIKPMAEQMGFHVFYFSFMEQHNYTMQTFTHELVAFLDKISKGSSKLLDKLKQVSGIDLFGVGIELAQKSETPLITVSTIISEIAQRSDKPILMLLDEVQELARIKGANGFIRSLRTGLDINQNKVKVIFTGSSTNGLRAMFNDNKAPFFHFAHPLDFPNLTKAFTDFLADIYYQRTQKQIDKDIFFALFKQVNFTPLYLRAITQDMIVNPDLSLSAAAQYRLAQFDEQSDNYAVWQTLSELEHLLLKYIAGGNLSVYSKAFRTMLAEQLGVNDISASTIQGKLRKLEKHELITRNLDNHVEINNPHFKTWIIENKQD